MKRFTTLTAIILAFSSHIYANNLSLEDTNFVESIIRKEFPTAKYDNEDKVWRLEEEKEGYKHEYKITYDFKQIDTRQGKIAGLVINKSLGAAMADKIYVYELKHNNNKWNIQTQSILGNGETSIPASGNGYVLQLNNQKFGFELVTSSYGTAGTSNEYDLIYSVNGKYQHLSGCASSDYAFDIFTFECSFKGHTDISETDEFYPIELNYSLSKYQTKEGDPNKPVPKGWEWVGSYGAGNLRKLTDQFEGTVIAEFDDEKQTYVLPNEFLEAFNAKNQGRALWDYFEKSQLVPNFKH